MNKQNPTATSVNVQVCRRGLPTLCMTVLGSTQEDIADEIEAMMLAKGRPVSRGRAWRLPTPPTPTS